MLPDTGFLLINQKNLATIYWFLQSCKALNSIKFDRELVELHNLLSEIYQIFSSDQIMCNQENKVERTGYIKRFLLNFYIE